MSTQATHEPTSTTATRNGLSGWDELRQLADQLELEIHLGGMEARSTWQALKPRLEDLERRIAKAGAEAAHSIAKEISALRETLRGLRNGIDHVDP
jgi:hypothetical protein